MLNLNLHLRQAASDMNTTRGKAQKRVLSTRIIFHIISFPLRDDHQCLCLCRCRNCPLQFDTNSSIQPNYQAFFLLKRDNQWERKGVMGVLVLCCAAAVLLLFCCRALLYLPCFNERKGSKGPTAYQKEERREKNK